MDPVPAALVHGTALAWQLARPTGWRSSWTDGRDQARPIGWPSGSLAIVLEADAVQVPRKPSPQVSQGEISGNELARVRCCSAAAGKRDTLVVRPVKAGMFSRGQTCRGRSQSPVVWIAREMATEPSKP